VISAAIHAAAKRAGIHMVLAPRMGEVLVSSISVAARVETG